MILLDTSGLLAALFTDQRDHEQCARLLKQAEGPFLLSPFVLVELDYLITKFAGVATELILLQDIAREAYQLTPFDHQDIRQAHDLIARFRDLGIGLADASISVLANRYNTPDLLTLDEKHFRVLPGPRGLPFRLLPADL